MSLNANIDDGNVDNPYVQIVEPSLPRLLSLLDRNRFSPTFGCFDRAYWHYKTSIDFPCPSYQDGCLALALLWANPFQGNFLYQRPETLGWALGAMKFWASIRRSDGSFDEWYPFERSFVATAFSTYSISESFLILKDSIPFSSQHYILEALKSAGRWLVSHDDYEVANHAAGAAAALWNLYLLTGDDSFRLAARDKISGLERIQSPEGWFPEYGGADPGYQSMTIDYLTTIYFHQPEPGLFKMISRAVEFLDYFIHPDGSSGGTYGRRNTSYLVPRGLELMASHLQTPDTILHRFYRGLKKGTALFPQWMDDRYFVPFFTKFCQALIAWKKRPVPDLSRTYFYRFFPKSGHLVVSTRFFYLVSNLYEGGIFKLFAQDENKFPTLISEDSGYFLRLRNGSVATTQWHNSQGLYVGPAYNSQAGSFQETTVCIKVPFSKVNTAIPLRRWLVPFRLFNYTVGRLSGKAMEFFNFAVKKAMIVRARSVPVSLERTIIFGNRLLSVIDVLVGQQPIRSLGLVSQGAAMHVPSSRFYVPSKGYYIQELEEFSTDLVSVFNQQKKVRVERRFGFGEEGAFDVVVNGNLIKHTALRGGEL